MNTPNLLKEKALWLRQETLKIHKVASEIRIASCLSDIEIFVVLYYGRILSFKPENPKWEKRDRLIISKGHGAASLYPILADFGLISKEELKMVCKQGSRLGSIPDCSIAGFEAINGSLGFGLGIACGVALALKRLKLKSRIFVLTGDGELYEGATWEAIMFAGHHRLDNLILIVDNNKICMLDYCKNVINLEPLEKKFRTFGWKVKKTDGHNVKKLYLALRGLKKDKSPRPKVLIAKTLKGKGVSELENNPLCHVRSLNAEEIDQAIRDLNE